MSMFGLREGTWFLYSKTNPKWCKSGRCLCGGFMKPKEVDDALEKLKKQYGEPPEDLRWGYEKD